MKQTVGRILRKIYKEVSYFGFAYKCNICNRSFRKFVEIGEAFPVLKEKKVVGGGLRKAGCPYCYSTDRERLLKIYLTDFYKVSKRCGIDVLHIAPERGLMKYFQSNKNVNYYCGDKFTQGYSYPSFVKDMDIKSIPFEENMFDLILCNHVLEHVIDDKKAMWELCRVLKPSGIAILQVPLSLTLSHTIEDFGISDPKEREKLYGQFDHVRLYGGDYKERLESAGFKVTLTNLTKQSDLYKEFGINKEEDLFVATK